MKLTLLSTGVDLKKLREEAELAKKNAEREKLNETREDRELAVCFQVSSNFDLTWF